MTMKQKTFRGSTSIAYIDNISYNYFVSYSFQRTAAHRELEALYETSAKRGKMTREESQRLELLNEQTASRYAERIFDEQGILNATAVRIITMQRHEDADKTLIQSLRTEIEEEVLFLCSPIFRDAILFFNAQDKLINGINICFECDRIETIHGAHIHTDFKTFKYLKQLLLQLGHPVENPDQFKADEIMALIEKNKAKRNNGL